MVRDVCSTAEKSDIRDVCSTAGKKTTSEMYVALLIGSMKNDIRDVCSTADWCLGIPKILGDTRNIG